MKVKITDRWIYKTRGADSQEIVRVDAHTLESRVTTARGDVIVFRFTMEELAQIGLIAHSGAIA